MLLVRPMSMNLTLLTYIPYKSTCNSSEVGYWVRVKNPGHPITNPNPNPIPNPKPMKKVVLGMIKSI